MSISIKINHQILSDLTILKREMSQGPMNGDNLVKLAISGDSDYVLQRREDGKLTLLIHDLVENNELDELEKIAKANKSIQEPCRKIKLLYTKLMMFADELMNCVNNIEDTSKTMLQSHGLEKVGQSTFDLLFTAHQNFANTCFTAHVLAACSEYNDIAMKNVEAARGQILKCEAAFAFKAIQFEQEMKKKLVELDKQKQEIVDLQKKSSIKNEDKTKIIVEEMKRESSKQKKAIKNKDKLIEDLQSRLSTSEKSSLNKKLVGKSVTILIPQSPTNVKLISARKTLKSFPKIQLVSQKVSTKTFEEALPASQVPPVTRLPAMRPGIDIRRRWKSNPPTRRREKCLLDADFEDTLDQFLDFNYQNCALRKIE